MIIKFDRKYKLLISLMILMSFMRLAKIYNKGKMMDPSENQEDLMDSSGNQENLEEQIQGSKIDLKLNKDNFEIDPHYEPYAKEFFEHYGIFIDDVKNIYTDEKVYKKFKDIFKLKGIFLEHFSDKERMNLMNLMNMFQGNIYLPHEAPMDIYEVKPVFIFSKSNNQGALKVFLDIEKKFIKEKMKTKSKYNKTLCVYILQRFLLKVKTTLFNHTIIPKSSDNNYLKQIFQVVQKKFGNKKRSANNVLGFLNKDSKLKMVLKKAPNKNIEKIQSIKNIEKIQNVSILKMKSGRTVEKADIKEDNMTEQLEDQAKKDFSEECTYKSVVNNDCAYFVKISFAENPLKDNSEDKFYDLMNREYRDLKQAYSNGREEEKKDIFKNKKNALNMFEFLNSVFTPSSTEYDFSKDLYGRYDVNHFLLGANIKNTSGSQRRKHTETMVYRIGGPSELIPISKKNNNNKYRIVFFRGNTLWISQIIKF